MCILRFRSLLTSLIIFMFLSSRLYADTSIAIFQNETNPTFDRAMMRAKEAEQREEDLRRSTLLPLKFSRGFLIISAIVATISTAVFAGLNFSSAGTMDLGSTCGPNQRLPCGEINKIFNSGFYVSLGFTVGLWIGSGIALSLPWDKQKRTP